MAVTKIFPIKGRIGKCINYVMNPEKTVEADGWSYVDGINVTPETAEKNMMSVKHRYGKEDGIMAYHVIQSFAPGEVTLEVAHEIGIKLAEKMWGDRFEVVVSTHLDHEHIHNHFVFNSVSFVDGKKYNDDKRNLYRLREVSDELCREYKLSVVLNPRKSRGIPYNEYMNEKNMKLTKNAIIKTEIDETILTSISRKDFFNQMKKKGYTFNFTSRYSTVYHPAFKRPTRLITLGDDYVPMNLIKRIDESWRRYPVNLPPQDNLYRMYIGDEPTVGYAQTYVRFITIVEAVRKRPDNNRVAVKYLADEIRKLNRLIEQQNLLCGNDIETPEQLEAYKQGCKDELAELNEARNILRSKLKTAQNHGDENEIRELKGHISDLTGRMKILRKNITVCERIEQKKPGIDEKLQDIKEIYQPTRNKNYERSR